MRAVDSNGLAIRGGQAGPIKEKLPNMVKEQDRIHELGPFLVCGS